MNEKKFISPGAWFSINYPADWNEFEDGEGSFLFYNPDEWTGNFRISAYKGESGFGFDALQQELRENTSATPKVIGAWKCAYSKEMFQEEGAYYTSHFWVIDGGNLVIECSFTVPKGASPAQAEAVISSIEVRQDGVKYQAEVIPVRLSEIYQINEAYEWVSALVKEQLKKDFQGIEEDIPHIQQAITKLNPSPKKREVWLSLGIALCVILSNEVDGMEWGTLMDGNREAPVLMYNGQCIDPMKLVWSKVKNAESIDLVEIYKKIL